MLRAKCDFCGKESTEVQKDDVYNRPFGWQAVLEWNMRPLLACPDCKLIPYSKETTAKIGKDLLTGKGVVSV